MLDCLRGWSAEFIVSDDILDGMNRTIRRAELHGISLVDQPAYTESVAEIQHRYEQRAAGVQGTYRYGQTETISDTGRNRKRRIRPNAFSNVDRRSKTGNHNPVRTRSVENDRIEAIGYFGVDSTR